MPLLTWWKLFGARIASSGMVISTGATGNVYECKRMISVPTEKGKTMSECMMFPKNWEKFIEDYSFKDSEEVYTNGTNLVPVFRVEQMVEHYFNNAWIPVSERLPDWRDGKVLVSTKYGMSICERTVNGRWKGQHANWIAHWMPLPEPPKEVSNGQT